MAKVRASGFVIYRKLLGIEYLLMQASYEPHHWTPPKGHMETGETEKETAFRETEEEAGLKKSDLRVHKDFKKVLQYTANGKPKEVIYFLAELSNKCSEVKLSNEHQAFKWAPLDEACKLAGYADTIDLLTECDKFLKNKN